MYDFERYHRVRVERVIDGDTVVLSFYLGLGIWLNDQSVRFLGINAPEMTGEENEQGKAVKVFLEGLLRQASDIVARTDEEKKGKYGRFLVTLFAKGEGKWHNVNELLVQRGAAREYMSSEGQPTIKEILDTPAGDLEERITVDEVRTEKEVYNTGDVVLTDEDVADELVAAAEEILSEYKGE